MKLGEFITIKEASEMYDYSERHLRYLIHAGKLESNKIGSMWWIKESSLLDYLNEADKKGESDKRYKRKDTSDE